MGLAGALGLDSEGTMQLGEGGEKERRAAAVRGRCGGHGVGVGGLPGASHALSHLLPGNSLLSPSEKRQHLPLLLTCAQTVPPFPLPRHTHTLSLSLSLSQPNRLQILLEDRGEVGR